MLTIHVHPDDVHVHELRVYRYFPLKWRWKQCKIHLPTLVAPRLTWRLYCDGIWAADCRSFLWGDTAPLQGGSGDRSMPQGKVVYGSTGWGGVGTRVLGQQQRGQVTGTTWSAETNKSSNIMKFERERESESEREKEGGEREGEIVSSDS